MPEWMKNRALRKRVIREVLAPAGVAPLSREVFLAESVRNITAEIEFGRAYGGGELWIRPTLRSPRTPRVMAALR